MSDLLLHFLAGALVAIIIMFVFGRYDYQKQRRQDWVVMLACMLPLFVGLAKEGADEWIYHSGADAADLTLTWFGGIAGAFFIIILDMFRTNKS